MRRIQDLFDDMGEAVNLVDKEHIVRFKVGQNGRQIARPFDAPGPRWP